MPLLAHDKIHQLVCAARQLPGELMLTPTITSRQDQQRGQRQRQEQLRQGIAAIAVGILLRESFIAAV
ncbi:hypothetical protein [Candidatus Sodalis pierantonius]|uniref:hypothetical protein n=1 Tax=Candidatus Sodalis pierantonii TaxID=1486991 RepID=UPI0004AFC459|nr:hypothetical protein [Candidatus Sodalis pierantonius]